MGTNDSEVVEEEERLPARVSSGSAQKEIERDSAILEEESVVPAILEKAPPEVRRSMEAFIAMMSQGPIPNPVIAKLVEKFTPDHIAYLLETQDRDTEREYKALASGRRYQIACLLIGVGLFVFLVVYFSSSNPDLLEKLVALLVGLIGGFGGGFALASRGEKT